MFSCEFCEISKGLVAHNDIIKIYRTISFKNNFQNILKLILKYFRSKRFSKQKSKFIQMNAVIFKKWQTLITTN